MTGDDRGCYSNGPRPIGTPPIPPLFTKPGDDQPLGEIPDVQNWVDVMQAIDKLKNTALTQIRELHRELNELRRDNVAKDAQIYALTLKLDAAVNESHNWRMRATGGSLSP